MKRAALAVFAAALVPLALPASGQPSDAPPPAKRRVLITAFEPFEGREENNSTRIANMMKAHPELFAGIEITVCTLPVVYDEGARVAQACMERMPEKPDLVLSLGEVGCKIQIETRAFNEDDGFGPDNAGNVRVDRTIIEGAAATIGYDIPGQAMFCALSPEERKLVDISNRMNYVCNNTAFWMAAKVMKGTGIPYGFVHVPTTESYCGDANDPLLNARTIAHMIGGAFADRRTNRAATYALPHCTNDERLPTSLDELSRAAASIAEAEGVAACEKEFLDKLKELM